MWIFFYQFFYLPLALSSVPVKQLVNHSKDIYHYILLESMLRSDANGPTVLACMHASSIRRRAYSGEGTEEVILAAQ